MPEWHEIAAQMLAEARAEVPVADSKAGTVLSTLGIGFGVLGAGLIAGDWSPGALVGIAAICWWLGVAAAVAAIGCAGAALWPRFTTNDASASDAVHYWGHAAGYSSSAALTRALQNTTTSNAARTSHQLWRLARAVHRKHQLVRAALASAGAATVLIGAAFGLQAVIR